MGLAATMKFYEYHALAPHALAPHGAGLCNAAHSDI